MNAHEPARPPQRIVRALEHPVVQIAVPILVTCVAVYVLHKFASQVHWADVKADIAGSSKKSLGFALLWTVVSFFALSFYDVFAVRSIAKGKVPDKIAGLAGASGYAISNLLGFSYLTGTAVRYRVYAAMGLDLARVAGVIATSWVAFWMGLILILGTLMTLHPKGLSTVLSGPLHPHLPMRFSAASGASSTIRRTTPKTSSPPPERSNKSTTRSRHCKTRRRC